MCLPPDAMKALLLFPLLASVALADAPQKPALTRYIQLWSDSPFTRKPAPEQMVESTPLDDYALGGVSPVDGGYFVILLNRKKPDERIILQPGQPSEFRVLEVRHGGEGPLSTTVLVGSGGKSKILGFDEKLLALKSAPTGKPQGQPGQTVPPPGVPVPQAPVQAQPSATQPGPQGQGGVRPRPRVIPPPKSTR